MVAHDLTNRSLERGIVVLETLAQRGACSLSDLHQATALPKSTLRRLLAPLVGHHLVRRSLGDQLYRINIALPLMSSARATPEFARIAEVAGPHMVELTRRIKWPTELHLFSGENMRVLESTRAHSPFELGSAKMDLEVNLFGSASGRAYLSTLPAKDIQKIITDVREIPRWSLARLHMNPDELLAEIEQVRALGYATRSEKYDGESRPPDKLRAIAVPIIQGRVATGALTLIWPHRHLSPEQFAALYLSELRVTTAQISADLAKVGAHSNDA